MCLEFLLGALNSEFGRRYLVQTEGWKGFLRKLRLKNSGVFGVMTL
jgi:hypothetical protein